MHICTSACQLCLCRRFHARLCVCMHTVCTHKHLHVGVCQCVYARTAATSIMQARELLSVKSTLTFMVPTSQGHPKVEHLEWSVTFQTENNSRGFSGLWRRLFILSLTHIHFDLVREIMGQILLSLAFSSTARTFSSHPSLCMLSVLTVVLLSKNFTSQNNYRNRNTISMVISPKCEGMAI